MNIQLCADEQVCGNCKHFYQHYTVSTGRYVPVNSGHCARPRLKHRKPLDEGCIHWKRREDLSECFE